MNKAQKEAVTMAAVNAPAMSTGALVAMLNTAQQNAATGMPNYRKAWAVIAEIYRAESSKR